MLAEPRIGPRPMPNKPGKSRKLEEINKMSFQEFSINGSPPGFLMKAPPHASFFLNGLSHRHCSSTSFYCSDVAKLVDSFFLQRSWLLYCDTPAAIEWVVKVPVESEVTSERQLP